MPFIAFTICLSLGLILTVLQAMFWHHKGKPFQGNELSLDRKRQLLSKLQVMTISVTLGLFSALSFMIDTKYVVFLAIPQGLRLLIAVLAVRDFYNELEEARLVFILTARNDAKIVLVVNLVLQVMTQVAATIIFFPRYLSFYYLSLATLIEVILVGWQLKK